MKLSELVGRDLPIVVDAHDFHHQPEDTRTEILEALEELGIGEGEGFPIQVDAVYRVVVNADHAEVFQYHEDPENFPRHIRGECEGMWPLPDHAIPDPDREICGYSIVGFYPHPFTPFTTDIPPSN